MFLTCVSLLPLLALLYTAANLSADSTTVRALQLDQSSFDSIRSFVDAYNKQVGKLDVLINNAGIMMTPYGKTKDGLEQQIGTNHFGHFLLTVLLLPLVLQSRGRIVNVSSAAHFYVKTALNYEQQANPKTYDRTICYGQCDCCDLIHLPHIEWPDVHRLLN